MKLGPLFAAAIFALTSVSAFADDKDCTKDTEGCKHSVHTALAFKPPSPRVCLIAKCSEGFSLDTEICRCVSDGKPKPICRAVIICKPDSVFDPKTCRCKDNLFEKAVSSEKTEPTKSEKQDFFPKFDPSKPASGDPTPRNPDPKTIPEPKIPCPPRRLCYP